MAKFLAGLICGIALALALPAAAIVNIEGNGALVGWTIVSGPARSEALSCGVLYIWTSLRQIECMNAPSASREKSSAEASWKRG